MPEETRFLFLLEKFLFLVTTMTVQTLEKYRSELEKHYSNL